MAMRSHVAFCGAVLVTFVAAARTRPKSVLPPAATDAQEAGKTQDELDEATQIVRNKQSLQKTEGADFMKVPDPFGWQMAWPNVSLSLADTELMEDLKQWLIKKTGLPGDRVNTTGMSDKAGNYVENLFSPVISDRRKMLVKKVMSMVSPEISDTWKMLLKKVDAVRRSPESDSERDDLRKAAWNDFKKHLITCCRNRGGLDWGHCTNSQKFKEAGSTLCCKKYGTNSCYDSENGYEEDGYGEFSVEKKYTLVFPPEEKNTHWSSAIE